MLNSLPNLHARLGELSGISKPSIYRIPSLWVKPSAPGKKRIINVDPVQFFQEKIGWILEAPDESPVMLSSSGEWTKEAVAYNLFVRQTTAWDHDGDGKVRIEEIEGGFRETGTFLKSIALLPYLKYLGINTIQMLPVTSIGVEGKKGTLGSPYAIKNPCKIEERLSEPWLGLGAEAEFAAFVEAAHRLGMRVLIEFVFRTASKDSDWIPDHPNWFYWIGADLPDRDRTPEKEHGYGAPRFTDEELRVISLRVKRNDTSSLPPPPSSYRQMYAGTPAEIEMMEGRYIGTTEEGRKVRIPGAFADWPPDDVQPPWDDVTYLKLYEHPSFNYIAYNTIRIYDARLVSVENENRGLWNAIVNIIPHYIKNFNIDGVMIDMGHALPRRLKQLIVERARKMNPDFAFWEENFTITPKSRQEGYNAAVGYLWSDEHIPGKLKEFCDLLSSRDLPVPFLATSETHNTPRAASRPGGATFSKMAFIVNSFLPGVLYIHQGYELGETIPVNTGLGFTAEEIQELPSASLPLFSESMLSWNSTNEFSSLISKVTSLRKIWELIVFDQKRQSFLMLPTKNKDILAFARCTRNRDHVIVIVANMDCARSASAEVTIPFEIDVISDALSEAQFQKADDVFNVHLEPGQAMIFPLTDPPA